MAERKFKFISPGIFVDEIDNSQLTRVPGDIGPVIIGRTERGPAMKPVKIGSFSEYVEIFGNPVAGGDGTDVYRYGNTLAPTYAAYAAQAWLKNNNAVTIVRLLGTDTGAQAVADTGDAGWDTGVSTAPDETIALNAGAYGLFLIDSGSTEATGTLAATFYATKGTAFALAGETSAGTTTDAAAATYVESIGTNEFNLVVTGASGARNFRINFTDSSPFFIRKALNTNPTLTNDSVTANSGLDTFWLGESYEGMVSRHVTSTGAGEQYGWIAALSDGTNNAGKKRFASVSSRTGYVIAQDLTNNTGSFDAATQAKLFRFVALENGDWEQQNLKISIKDIKKSTSVSDPYGTFSVTIRLASDSDNAPRVVEQFAGCNLNPNSTDYVGRKIGDTFTLWSDTERRHRWVGRFPNVSQYVRVEMNADLDAGGGNSDHLPWGFFGAPRYKRFAVSGALAGGPDATLVGFDGVDADPTTFIRGSGSIPLASEIVGIIDCSGSDRTDPYLFPAPLLRLNSAEGTPPSLKNCYWGVTTSRPGSTSYDPSYRDAVRVLGGVEPGGNGDQSDDAIENAYVFTLDDISASAPTSERGGLLSHISGSRESGKSFRGTATGDGVPIGAAGSGSIDILLKSGIDRFTMDLHGGFDGLNITEKEPFCNRVLDENNTATPIDNSNYAFNSVKRAIDSVSDPEVVEYNLMVAPGITHEGLTTHMINVCSDRGDALAIIDLKGDYRPTSETTDGFDDRRGSVDAVVQNLENRALNSSYGCAYYPWVQIRDPQAGNYVWVPPSIVALGTLASSEKRAELWFAPAGFNRGGLTEGSAGLPVVNVTDRLTSDNRDTLYAANVNPIATFPAEGIVIFGQKTLQVTPSALDRINVRRLMIYVKKEISRMATHVLFDQNIRSTWNRFLGMAKPFLRSIMTRFGLDDYKVVLDETTTTPDLIDRNIMYAKIFLKPSRSIEFIALDFTITNAGASFTD